MSPISLSGANKKPADNLAKVASLDIDSFLLRLRVSARVFFLVHDRHFWKSGDLILRVSS